MEKTMNSAGNYSFWDEIERSESYLVCCMFEEAASSASSIISGLHAESTGLEDIELNDMLESAGMVLVQSWKELGRTSVMLKELTLLFGAATSIPLQVLLTGVCYQIQEHASGVSEFLEEFLSQWKCVGEQYYAVTIVEGNMTHTEQCERQVILGVDEYLEIVEVYVVTVLAASLNRMDLAISWIEKAEIPAEKQQDLLRRLHSMRSSEASSSSHGSVSPMLVDERRSHSATVQGSNKHKELSDAFKVQDLFNGENGAKRTSLRSSLLKVPCLWWFHSITLKFGNSQFVISKESFLLGLLAFFIYYLMWMKRTSLKRVLKRHALSMKKALVDLWQLAFSYQVNPLAAVQPLPVAPRGNQ